MRSLIVIPGVVLSVVLSLTLQADVDITRDAQSRRHVNDRSEGEIILLYLSLSDLSLEDQRQQMWALSSTTKAALWTFNIERYLRDHPELSAEGQEALREGIRLVTTPAWFDIAPDSPGHAPKSTALDEFKGRIRTSLSPETIVEVFIRLGTEPAPLVPVTETPAAGSKSRFTPRAEIYGCTCSGSWECGFFQDYACDLSWCDPVPHCGIFGNETCWGRCKRQI